MNHEQKAFAFDFEVKTEDDARTIEGWASVFDNVDAGKDIIVAGAFARTLAKRKAGDKIPMLWQHNTGEPIGVWHDMKEIDKGLYAKGEIFDTMRGLDAYKLVKGGAVKGLSIGYAPKQFEIDQKKGVRKLMEVELYETSLVTFPMNDKAQVTRIKSLEGLQFEELFEHKRKIEAALWDAGASDRVATYVASLIPNPAERDAGGEESKELSELFGRFAQQFTL